MSTQQVSRNHPVLVVLHWMLAFLIMADLAIGALVLVHIPNGVPKKIEGLQSHIGAGVAILMLVLVRLWVRLGTTEPADASTGSRMLDRAVWWSHRLLYVLVIAMASSGLVMGLQAHLPEILYFGHGNLFPSFWIYRLRSVHFVLSRLLMAMIALHIAGAFYHTFVRKDHLLRRMWFGRRALAASSASSPKQESKQS